MTALKDALDALRPFAKCAGNIPDQAVDQGLLDVNDAMVERAVVAAMAARNALPFFGAINSADEVARITMRAALQSALRPGKEGA